MDVASGTAILRTWIFPHIKEMYTQNKNAKNVTMIQVFQSEDAPRNIEKFQSS